MTEIDEAAKAIIDSKSKDEIPKPINFDNPFIGLTINTIYKNRDKFDDPFLLQALDVATTFRDEI